MTIVKRSDRAGGRADDSVALPVTLPTEATVSAGTKTTVGPGPDRHVGDPDRAGLGDHRDVVPS